MPRGQWGKNKQVAAAAAANPVLGLTPVSPEPERPLPGMAGAKAKGTKRKQEAAEPSEDPKAAKLATIQCHICGEYGHYKNKCPSKQK